MALASLPHPLLNGTPQDGAQVYADLTAILNQLNGGLDSTNLSPSAGILGSQLTTAAGQRITAPNLEDAAVDGRILKKDATTGGANAAVNDPFHVKDGVIQNRHHQVNSIKQASLNLLQIAWTPNGSIGPNVSNSIDTASLGAGPALVGDILLGVHWSGSSPIPGDIGEIVKGAYRNATTGHWHLFYGNPAVGAVDITGWTLVGVWVRA